MKSRIRNAIPKKIIGINISSQKRDIIEDIALEYQQSFKQLLAYLEIMQKSNLNYFMEVEYETSEYLKIDFNSKFNLELLTTIKNNNKSNNKFLQNSGFVGKNSPKTAFKYTKKRKVK